MRKMPHCEKRSTRAALRARSHSLAALQISVTIQHAVASEDAIARTRSSPPALCEYCSMRPRVLPRQVTRVDSPS